MGKLRLFAIAALVIAFVFYHLLVLTKCNKEYLKGKISGRNVLVTGASSGIGEQVAYLYAKLGANVFITARREERLKRVVSRCKDFNPDIRSEYVVADMGKVTEVDSVITKAVEFLGGLDVIILNHAIVEATGFWDSSITNVEDLHRFMTVNFESYVELASKALSHLKATDGQIGIISSVVGSIPNRCAIGYVASKHAVNGFFSTLRSELSYQNINVSLTIFHCGLVGTEVVIESEAKYCEYLSLQPDCLQQRMGFASVSDAAEAIVSSVTQRHYDVWWPKYQLLWWIKLVHHIIPSWVETFV